MDKSPDQTEREFYAECARATGYTLSEVLQMRTPRRKVTGEVHSSIKGDDTQSKVNEEP